MFRDTWLEVNLDAIKNNIEIVRNTNHKKIIAVIKANAYGIGAKQVCEASMRAHASMIAVSSLDEAIAMRNFGYDGELLILGHTNPKDLDTAKQNNISITVYSLNYAKEIANNEISNLKVHLKVDTGMNRIGFKDLDELSSSACLLEEKGCILDGIFTHYAKAENDKDFTAKQFEKFKEAYDYLQRDFKWIHCDNSAAAVSFKEDLTNACRIGIGLYGISVPAQLHNALALYSRIFLVKKVHKGESIGYGATFTADEDMWIATMPIGYADGFLRANQGRKVYIDGYYCEIVGRVCMDQCMVRLPEQFRAGMKVEIFGEHIKLDDMALELNTVTNEIISLITSRVTRVYIENEKIISVDNEYLDYSELYRKNI